MRTHVPRSYLLRLVAFLVISVGDQVVAADESVPSAMAKNVTSHAVPDRLDIPVSWRQTRGRMGPKGPSTQTESFRETWRLSSDGSGNGWLDSGRVKVRVLRQFDPASGSLAFVVDERSLAQLLGILKSEWNFPAEQDIAPRLFKFNLSPVDDAMKIGINLAEDEHYLIQIQFWSD